MSVSYGSGGDPELNSRSDDRATTRGEQHDAATDVDNLPAIARSRPWRERTKSEQKRPGTVVELLGDVVRVCDEARGNPQEVEHVQKLLIRPILKLSRLVALVFLGAILTLIGLVVGATMIIRGVSVDLHPLAELNTWLTVGGVGSATVMSTILIRRFRRRRQRIGHGTGENYPNLTEAAQEFGQGAFTASDGYVGEITGNSHDDKSSENLECDS
jgi:hypothetical protein